MDYKQAMAFMHGTERFGSKPGLTTMRSLMARLGSPEKRLRFIHIAGTNGKGSTAAFISSVLIAAGYNTGVYTSPYISRFGERITANREEIPEGCVAALATAVAEKITDMTAEGEPHPTEFEIVTAMAFMYFERLGCDAVVLEVGLGGRLDATNVIERPELAVITPIDYDHTEWLGKTLEEIAFEKAGIIKEGGDVLTHGQREEVMRVLESVCAERGASLRVANLSAIKPESFSHSGQTFSLGALSGLSVALLGGHQLENAAAAVTAAEMLSLKGYAISEDHLRAGLSAARWPGRFEWAARKPDIIIDGAHNSQGARVLAGNLKQYFPGKKVIFVMGVFGDKDYDAMINATLPVAGAFITVTPGSPRGLDAQALANRIDELAGGSVPPATVSDGVRHALGHALSMAGPDGIVCVFGSLYNIADARDFFK